MDFCIHKFVLGSDKHVINRGDLVAFDDEIPDDVLLVLPPNVIANNDIRLLFALENKDIDTSPPTKYAKQFSLVSRNCQNILPPWKKIIPKDVYKQWVKTLVETTKLRISELDSKYFINTFSKQNSLFDSFNEFPIDLDKIRFYEKNDPSFSNKSTITSFYPKLDGLSQKIKYDRISSRTGRLTVKSGPKVLTLKKEYRDIIKSRFKGGRIMSVDYSSLEARILLYSMGHQTVNGDLYDQIREAVFNGDVDRPTAKLGCLAVIFGSGEASLSGALNIDRVKAKSIIKEIKKYFKVYQFNSDLTEKIQNESIRNHYGRLVILEDRSTLVNSYIQSTGVDVALLGFTKLVNVVENTDIIPLFVLHDALVLDVPAHEDLEKYTSVCESIPGFVQRFPVHVEPFSR